MAAGGNPLLDLVSNKVGIIKSLARVFRGADEPSPPVIYTASLSHFDYRMAEKWERLTAGKGRTEEEAIGGAIGEAVERYCAAHVDTSRQVLSAWRDVESRAITPPEFVLYSDSQYQRRSFPYHRWDPKDQVTWTPAVELPGRRDVLVPSALVYLTSTGPRVEDALTPSTSNGLAAGPDLDSAVLGGFHELMERDAFLVTWMNRLPAPEVVYEASGGFSASIQAHYRRFGVEIRVFRMLTDLPGYTMMAMAMDSNPGRPATLVGLGCHLDPGVALLKAILEICQVRPGEKQRYRSEPPLNRLKRYEDVRKLEDHSAYLSPPERRDEFDFLLKGSEQEALASLPSRSTGRVDSDLEVCIRAFAEKGYRASYIDLTTPDVRDYGLHAVRTLVTQLQPIHFGFGEERLGGRRLFELPRRLGFGTDARSERDLNPCPHPLA